MTLESTVKSIIGNPEGQCYAASEAYYHLVGGSRTTLQPQCMRLPEGSKYKTHWYLMDVLTKKIIDLTADQFDYKLDYSIGRGKGFLTKKPSKKAQAIIKAVKVHENQKFAKTALH